MNSAGQERGETSGRTTRRTTALKMASKAVKEEEAAGMATAVAKLTLQERESTAEKDIEEMELRRRVRRLEAKRERMRRDEELAIEGQEPHDAQPVGGEEAAPRQEEVRLEQDAGVGHSNYGRSRRHSRGRRCHRHNSSSSRSRSSSKRRKGKWSLRKFTFAEKKVRNLNPHELIHATTKWALNIECMTVADHRALLEHIGFLSLRAMTNDFRDVAHIEYDRAIRKQAELSGFSSFGTANNGTSVSYYGPQSMKFKKEQRGDYNGKRAGGVRHATDNRVCFRWNSEAGCLKTEEDCIFGHCCAKCGSKGHRRQKCKD